MSDLLLIWLYVLIRISTSTVLPPIKGRVYDHMTYNASSSTLAQLTTKSKLQCAAQCANQFASCNTAVYDSTFIPPCVLFSEPLSQANLVPSTHAVVYDFQERKFRATTSTTTTTTTTTTKTTSTTTTTIAAPQCSSYISIVDDTRNVAYTAGSPSCDSSTGITSIGWYRFSGASGTVLANYAVPPNQCGTSASGWYNGTYPSVTGDSVSGTVCYNFGGNTCSWSSGISVIKCDGYYVYYLSPSPACNLRYCTM